VIDQAHIINKMKKAQLDKSAREQRSATGEQVSSATAQRSRLCCACCRLDFCCTRICAEILQGLQAFRHVWQ